MMPLLFCSNSRRARRLSIRPGSCCAAAIPCTAIASTTWTQNSEDDDVDRELKKLF